MRLEFVEPNENCEIKMGTFQFTENGAHVECDFFVKTCVGDVTKQADDYNEQLADQWDALSDKGIKDISYTEVVPNPIF